MRKIVAVLGYGIKLKDSAFSYPADTINAGYASAVIKAGALPFLVPSTLDDDVIENTVRRVDALLIPGGKDICPCLYGEENTYSEDTNLKADTFQLKMIEAAIKEGKPILGICRGLQLLNVYFGGTLYQDINKENNNALNHADLGRPEVYVHTVIIKEGSLLHSAMGKREIKVNSLHHQGIKKLGSSLSITAQSPDGLIEAIEDRKRKIIAVQWHPEALAIAGDEDAMKIFHLLTSLMES